MIYFIFFYKNICFLFIESLCKEDLIHASSLLEIKSKEWKIFEMSAHTGIYSIPGKKIKVFFFVQLFI